MSKIAIPACFQGLLHGELESAIGTLANRTEEILADNKLVFFPDYTDHGVEHISRVLQSETDLVPASVWAIQEQSDLLGPADVAVIVGATLLHDIAMHLRPHGFLELIRGERFKPLPWFRDDHDGYVADKPWCELWHEYLREARRFSDRVLINLIGEASAREGWNFHDLPKDVGQWTRNHCLVIGEFIRRHHARLAHEIAIYGFPGVQNGAKVGEFPALGSEGHQLHDLADLIGLTARSHGMSLRVCQAYLEDHPLYADTPRPMGTAVLFPMALLRVADYLQLEHQRAPAVLLQLRDPQSPVSINAWKSHQAVRSIDPHKDPNGIKITIADNIPLELYLQLRDLLDGLQSEMDHSTAVLQEVYGRYENERINHLTLAKNRIHTNLTNPKFRSALPYVPERTGFSADPNILTLLVEPLYGKHPGVGVRELIQNAVDAVTELHTWCNRRGIDPNAISSPDQPEDVLVEFVENEDGRWILRCTDRGVGMTEAVLRRHFFQAGSSFRWSDEWIKEFSNDSGEVLVARAGRFGIGAFATFLLGDSFRLWTRHVADKSGFFAEVVAGRPIIEVRRIDKPVVGTCLEIDLTEDTVKTLELEFVAPGVIFDTSAVIYDTDWFVNDWPIVTRRVVRASAVSNLRREFSLPFPRENGFPHWSTIYPKGFSSVCWGLGRRPRLVCNGIRIQYPEDLHPEIDWPLKNDFWRPSIVVTDTENNLPLTIQRYQLSRGLPFTDELARDVVLSFIAHALVCGPTASPLFFKDGPHKCRHPLVAVPIEEAEQGRDVLDQELADSEWGTSRYTAAFSDVPLNEILNDSPSGGKYLNDGQLRWFATHTDIVPCDSWLFSLLGSDNYIVYGTVESRSGGTRWPISANTAPELATCCWDVVTAGGGFSWDVVSVFFSALCQYGIRLLDRKVIGARVLISARLFDWEMERLDGVTVDRVARTGARPAYFKQQLTFGTVPSTVDIENYLDEMERRGGHREMFYVAEIATRARSAAPNSALARLWNECIGQEALPFSPEARNQLVEAGRAHTELVRHIEAWEQMRSTR